MAKKTTPPAARIKPAELVPLDLSEDEVSGRVAVLKRFKELLRVQRDKFRAYLEALDRQKDVIEKGSVDDLASHVELEENIVTGIAAIQKVIDPLEDMYRSLGGGASLIPVGEDGEEEDVPNLKSALEGLKAEAIARSDRNRKLLSKRMAELRNEIKSLRSNPYLKRPSAGYGGSPPSLIDIQG